jgi:glycosyltransferase involved in cell wall biosynthesis
MRRVAIVEYLMSAGGVERVLRGLASAFLEIPEAREWEITFLLAAYRSSGARSEWPATLTGPSVSHEWLGARAPLARIFDPLVAGAGIAGLDLTRLPGHVLAGGLRSRGPRAWRALAGDPRELIARASRRFDLLYFPFPVAMDVPDMAIPVATTPQDFNFRHFMRADSRRYAVMERLTRRWLARSDRILLTSEAVRAELEAFYPEHAAKAEVIPLGLIQSARVPSGAELEAFRRERGVPARFVLVAGWIEEHKNQLVVIQALEMLRRRGTSVPVVFVGPNSAHLLDAGGTGIPSPYVQRVRNELRRGGFAPGRDFHALGYVTDRDVQCLYRLASVFVFPSLYEGFGLPGLEAMLAGCPTVLSTIPPLAEQNRRLGGIVRTFDPGDAEALADHVAAVLGDPAAAAQAARVAAARVADVYDWKRTARAYLAEWDALISAATRRREHA